MSTAAIFKYGHMAGVTWALLCFTAQAVGAATAPGEREAPSPVAAQKGEPEAAEAPAPGPRKKPATQSTEIPRFAANSPFERDYESPIPKEGKRLWAQSYLWAEAPKLEVEKWLGKKPGLEGKYLLIEFWATWCAPCRRSIPLLNAFHEKFGDELAVIGISDEKEDTVRAFDEPRIAYYSAIDTRARMKNAFGVTGIPHSVIIEPGGHVVWEGFPLLQDYELTDEIVDQILEVGRKLRKK